jgi:peroxiredoxin
VYSVRCWRELEDGCEEIGLSKTAFDPSTKVGDRGVQVIGISVGERPTTVAAYAERYELGYLLLVDVNSELFRAAGAGGIPTKLILDADGRVLRVVTGPLTRETATALVEELLPTR